MRLIPANCPRCEAEQDFVPKLRTTSYRWQEEYIRCSICRYELLLRCTTPEIELALKNQRAYEQRADAEIAKHGTMSESTARAITRLRGQSSQLIGELAQEVRVAHGEPTHPDAA